jgi:hypothetical protein
VLACDLVENGATVQICDYSHSFGTPSLWWAVRTMDLDVEGTVNLVMVLLEKGAEPDDSQDGPSPLRISMARNDMAKCTYLLHQVNEGGLAATSKRSLSLRVQKTPMAN